MKKLVMAVFAAIIFITGCNSDLKKAKQYKEQGDWANAQEYYIKVVKASPNNARYHNELGYVYEKRGFLELAEKEYLKALNLDQYYIDARYNHGSVLFRMGRPEQAIQEFETVLKMDPNNARAMNNLGLLTHLYKKDNEKALELYQKAIKLEPANPSFHENIGMLYKDMGQNDKAQEEFKRAAALRSGSR